jgi:hypothetical protein
MPFANEPGHYGDRVFGCGWPDRQQSAADIAGRAQQFAQRLDAIDPAYGRIRPNPGMRKFRPGDVGPLLEMAPAELADLIDRRHRFDPPRLPAPVSPTGYNALFRNNLMGVDPSHLSVTIRAGIYGRGGGENGVEVSPHVDHPLWGDIERGVQVMDAMVPCWDAEWASAYRYIPGHEPPRERPWLAWTARPLQPRPKPLRPYPYPFPLDYAGPPAEVRRWHGGELRIWP